MTETVIKTLDDRAKELKAIIDESGDSMPVGNREVFEKTLTKIEAAKGFMLIHDLGGMTGLIQKVREWGEEKQITGEDAKATPYTQYKKLLEEVEEFNKALDEGNQHEMEDAIGDQTVVLILLAELIGARFENCLLGAYDVIRNRTGKMVDGQFVKDK